MLTRLSLLRRHLSALCAGLLLHLPLQGAGLSAVTESLPPLNYESGGVVTGYATELLQAVLQTAGLKAPVALLPWARAYQGALTQANTLIYSITRTPEREALFEWIGPISPRQIFLYKLRARKDVQIRSLADAGTYRIGLVREMASSKEFVRSSGVPAGQLDYAPTAESNTRKLLMGRVDLIVAQDWGTAFQLRALGRAPDELEAVLLLDDAHSYYFALNKQSDPALIAQLRQALEKVQQSGQMEYLKNKYLH